MSAETEQRTLTGKEADCGRTRPRTLLRCHKCDDYILRRERFDHDHYLPVASWASIDRLYEWEVDA